MVVAAGGAHEDGATGHRLDDLEAEDPRVELRRGLGVSNVQDGMVELGDWDHGCLRGGCSSICLLAQLYRHRRPPANLANGPLDFGARDAVFRVPVAREGPRTTVMQR